MVPVESDGSLKPVRKVLFDNECPPGPMWVWIVQFESPVGWVNDTTVTAYGFRSRRRAEREAERRARMERSGSDKRFRVAPKWIGYIPENEGWYDPAADDPE